MKFKDGKAIDWPCNVSQQKFPIPAQTCCIFLCEITSKVPKKNPKTQKLNQIETKCMTNWFRVSITRRGITLSSRRIHSLVLVAVDQWERRSASSTCPAFCDGDSRDIAFTLYSRGFTLASNSISIFLSLCDSGCEVIRACCTEGARERAFSILVRMWLWKKPLCRWSSSSWRRNRVCGNTSGVCF